MEQGRRSDLQPNAFTPPEKIQKQTGPAASARLFQRGAGLWVTYTRLRESPRCTPSDLRL